MRALVVALMLLLAGSAAAQQVTTSPTPLSALTELPIGASLYPVFQNHTGITATTTNASTTFTCVTLCSNLYVGVALYSGTVWPGKTVVTAINGTTITTSLAATADNASPISVQVGYDRWSTTSSLLANTAGFQTIWGGQAAVGNSTWVESYLGGDCQNLAKVTACTLLTSGSIGQVFGARSSDNVTASTSLIMTEFLGINDNTSTAHTLWSQYIETHANSGAATNKRSFGIENSMHNLNTVTRSDPFSVNKSQGTINERLDCGTGASDSPTNCDHPLDIVNNDAAYALGILFGSTALETSILTNPPAIALPAGSNGYSLAWYKATGFSTPAWQLYSNSTTTNGNKLVLQDAEFSYQDATNTYFDAATTFLRSSATGAAAAIQGRRLDGVSSGALASFVGQGQNTTPAVVTFGNITFNSTSNTAGAEGSSITFNTIGGGALALRATLSGSGLNLAGIPYQIGAVTVVDSSRNAAFVSLKVTPAVLISALPTCNAGAEGTLYGVSDATAPTYNATLTGGGTVHIPVYCDGTNWRSH